MTTSELRHAKSSDGSDLCYRVIGSGPARVALVHSLAMDGTFWTPVAELLSGVATVLLVDCRGHGASGKPPGPYTVELFADDLASVLQAETWPSAIVAGASMGGCVALAFAGRHPNKTAGLGLFDTTAWYGAEAPAQWSQRAQKAADEGMQGLVAFQRTRWFCDDFGDRHPEIVDQCVGIFLRNDVRAYGETCRMLGNADLRNLLPKITAPTAILVGEEDYATPPAMAEALHAGIAGSTLTVVTRGRHFTPLEHPERIADALKRLIEESKP